MAATNMILSESINKVDELVTAMSEEVTAIEAWKWIPGEHSSRK